MKKLSSIAILSVLSVFCFMSVLQAQNYEINGRIEGAEGVKFILQKSVSGKVVVLDTTVVVNGSFKITGGSVEYPEMVSLATLDRRKGFSFYLENAKMDCLT